MKAKHIVGFVVIAIIVAFFIAADCILFEPSMSNIISAQLCPPVEVETFEDDEEGGLSQGQAMSREIVEEGTVMVKNNGVLPLSRAEVSKVNVFGRASTDWLYSGSGSGQVQPETNDASLNVDFLKALTNYGIEYNTELANMYRRFLSPQGYGGAIGGGPGYYKIADPDIDDKQYYSDSLLQGAKEFSDTAFVVIGRRAGESTDPTKYQAKWANQETDYDRHYLEISTEEEKLLNYVGANYENVIVIINALNTMELGFVETIPGIDACLVMGGTGTRGASGLPGLIYGDVSPSGKLVDTYAYDMEDNVNFNHVGFDGITYYGNASGLYPDGVKLNSLPTTPTGPYYVDYIEGIYVGYKWYETADAEGIWDERTLSVLDNDGGKTTKSGFEAVVQYPFGYGLSYNEFSWQILPETTSNFSSLNEKTEIKVVVRVTNTSGTRSAKDVVELYMTPPYYDGEIEKSDVNLVGFAKTGEIAPGQYEDVTITLNGSDLASYDCYDLNENGNTGYEIDRGDYTLTLRTDSHHIKDGCKPITFNVPETINIKNDPVTNAAVDNLFTGEDAVDGVSVDGLGEAGGNQNVAYITRASFPKTTPEKAAARDIPDIVRQYNLFTSEDEAEWNSATTNAFGEELNIEPVTWGADNGLSLTDENGVLTDLAKELGNPENYDSEKWDQLLDQLNRSEVLNSIINISASGTGAVPSVGKPALTDRDGPVQAGGFVGGITRGVGFPSAFMIAQCWSQDIALRFGAAFGVEMQNIGFNGIFGPGCNIHRSPFGGRNFEYYSEDAFLSGTMAANAVYGMKTEGRYALLKHFAVAETETGRDSYYSWLSEQALREIYVKPFEMAVKDGGCVGIMSSYNRVGARWAGGSVGLQEGLLRREWGFRGAIITDFSDHKEYMNMNESIRMGGDMGMACNVSGNNAVGDRLDMEIRQTAKNVLYMWLNAEYTAFTTNLSYVSANSLSEPWIWWHPVLIDLSILAYASCALWLFMNIKGIVKNKKAKATYGADGGSEGGNGPAGGGPKGSGPIGGSGGKPTGKGTAYYAPPVQGNAARVFPEARRPKTTGGQQVSVMMLQNIPPAERPENLKAMGTFVSNDEKSCSSYIIYTPSNDAKGAKSGNSDGGARK